MASRIVLIDDERQGMSYYVKAMERKGYSVEQCLSVESALSAIKRERADLIVLDIMMPPGERYGYQETREGLLTGLFLYRDLRAQDPNVPVIVLTNVSERGILEELEPGPLLRIVSKPDCPPMPFAAEVADMLGKT